MVVKINAIEVAPGRGRELEERFARRATEVESMPGFLGFELLRPVERLARAIVVRSSGVPASGDFAIRTASGGELAAPRGDGDHAADLAAQVVDDRRSVRRGLDEDRPTSAVKRWVVSR